MHSTATPTAASTVVGLSGLRASDTLIAGGKGANLGELTSFGMPVPDGFVITAASWVRVRDHNELDEQLEAIFSGLDHHDVKALEHACHDAVSLVARLTIPDELRAEIVAARDRLVAGEPHVAVIVRSSATLEDSATASFAGMNETFANVAGEHATIDAIKHCWASQFAPRTVFYRAERGMPIASAELAVVVQRYLPALYSGVMFTSDPATGDTSTCIIEATIGGGGAIVSGHVTPDRFVLDSTTNTIVERDAHAKELRIVDDAGGGTHEELLEGDAAQDSIAETDVLRVAELGRRIAAHYGTPQDIEWLIDPHWDLWIVQSRPITTITAGAAPAGAAPVDDRPRSAETLLRGVPASAGVASGRVRIMASPDDGALETGSVLVARMTSPDWAPLMRRAAAIVTDTGGMTCHAAIVAREMGVPCVVGTRVATTRLHDRDIVTVDGSAGTVVAGQRPARHPAPHREAATAPAPVARQVTATSLMVNLSDIAQVTRVATMDCDGVGLIRAETMIVDALGGAHPLTLIGEGRIEEAARDLADGIARFATAFSPRPVTYRTIDFRTNEFRRLRGGEAHEPSEANPMIGFRGAGRYADQPEMLDLETRALAAVWSLGLTNVRVMLPFVRAPRDVVACRSAFERAGLLADDRFQLWVMAEVPSVRYHLAAYRDLGVAGISIGTNDLAQLLLGADRDSERLARYDATDPAVVHYIEELLERAAQLGLDTSICGQAPAVHPEYVDILVRAGIGSISVTPDALDVTRASIERAERRIVLEAARR